MHVSRLKRRHPPTCLFAARAQLHNYQWQTWCDWSLSSMVYALCRPLRGRICLLIIDFNRILGSIILNSSFKPQTSLIYSRIIKKNLILASSSLFRVVSWIMAHLTQFFLFIFWLKTVNALQIGRIHESLLQISCKLYSLHSKTSHAFPQQSLVCYTVKLKAAHSHRQTALFLVSVFTICHVEADLLLICPLWQLKDCLSDIEKKKNKGICKILSGLFCDHRQYHIIWHEGQQWGEFGGSRGFTNSKMSKCG